MRKPCAIQKAIFVLKKCFDGFSNWISQGKRQKYAKTRNRSNQNPNPAPKRKRETTNATNSQNTKRTHGQPNEKPSPKGGHPATETEPKTTRTHARQNVTDTPTPKTGNREPKQNHHPETASNEQPGGGGAQTCFMAPTSPSASQVPQNIQPAARPARQPQTRQRTTTVNK